jgi:hypothetical protein
MRKHKLNIIIKFLLVSLFVLGTGMIIGHTLATKARNASAQVPQHYLAATPQNLEYIGLSFTQIGFADSQAQGAIKKDQAIAIASSQGTELKAATGVSAVLGFLRNARLQQAAGQGISVDPHLADMGLVWLVTFHGVETSSMGPHQATRYISSEYNIVVDAKTGKYVMAFPLYDITPSAPTNDLTPVPGPINQATQLPTNANPSVAPTFAP